MSSQMQKVVNDMSNAFNKLTALLLTLAILFTCCVVPVRAETTNMDNPSDEEPQQERAVILPNIVEIGSGTLKLKFSMSANSLSPNRGVNTYTQTSSKYITTSNIPANSNSIYVSGSFTRSTSNTAKNIRIGLGPYDYSRGVVFDEVNLYVAPVSTFTLKLCDKSALTPGVIYYAVIHNECSSGTITGSVGFYYIQ